MSDAERSIAVKRKVAVTKPMSRAESPSETYIPKRQRSSLSSRDETPPPYIPSKKDVSHRLGASVQESVRSRLTRNDARHLLNKEERRELISRSRRRELLQSIGIQREERKSVQVSRSPDRTGNAAAEKMVHQREVKDERKYGGVKNFQITARVVTAPPETASIRRHRSRSPPSSDSRETLSEAATQQRNSVTSRLGKVVAEQRSASAINDAFDSRTKLMPAKRSTGKILTQVKGGSAGNSKIEFTGLGRALLKKQCEAAVMSVKAAQTAERLKTSRSPDSRVVCCDSEVTEAKKEIKEEEPEDEDKEVIVAVSDSEDIVSTERKFEESGIKRRDSSIDDDPEDLAEMISNDFEPEILEDSQNDEFTLDLDDDDIIKVVGDLEEDDLTEDLRDRMEQEEKKKGTRFIVTLDGIDERDFEEDHHHDKFKHPPVGSGISSLGHREHHVVLDALSAQSGSMAHPVLHTAHQVPQHLPVPQALLGFSHSTPAKLTPPKIQPFSISLKDSDDEHENKMETKAYTQMEEGAPEGLSAVKRAKLSERCKFWPACAVGGACEYWHPTTHCKTFPNCKFGDKCLFIHPNCRFDSKCTRPDCPYTHTSKRTGLASGGAHVIAIPQSHVLFSPTLPGKPYSAGFGAIPRLPSVSASQQTVCRFYPNCHNINCAFLHPKPCHFGQACRTPGCPFYHPSVPSKDKLKWQASQVSSPALQKAPPPTTTQVLSGPKPVPVSSAPTKLPDTNVNVSSTSQ